MQKYVSIQGNLYKNGIDVNLYAQPPPAPHIKEFKLLPHGFTFQTLNAMTIMYMHFYRDQTGIFRISFFIMYFLLCTYVHSRYHHRAHLKFEVTLQKCYTKKQGFFCFYLVWFDVGNDQSNDLTKKEKKTSLYSLPILQ